MKTLVAQISNRNQRFHNRPTNFIVWIAYSGLRAEILIAVLHVMGRGQSEHRRETPTAGSASQLVVMQDVGAIKILKGVAETQDASADGDVFAAIARFAWDDEKPGVALEYASRAINSSFISDGARVNSLLIAGDSYLQLRDSENAIPQLERLVKLRRRSQDWLLLGIARYQSGQKETGIAAVQHAVEIQPFRDDLHMTLSDMFKDSGQKDNSDVHRRRAALLNSQP